MFGAELVTTVEARECVRPVTAKTSVIVLALTPEGHNKSVDRGFSLYWNIFAKNSCSMSTRCFSRRANSLPV